MPICREPIIRPRTAPHILTVGSRVHASWLVIAASRLVTVRAARLHAVHRDSPEHEHVYWFAVLTCETKCAQNPDYAESGCAMRNVLQIVPASGGHPKACHYTLYALHTMLRHAVHRALFGAHSTIVCLTKLCIFSAFFFGITAKKNRLVSASQIESHSGTQHYMYRYLPIRPIEPYTGTSAYL